MTLYTKEPQVRVGCTATPNESPVTLGSILIVGTGSVPNQ